MKHWHEAPDVPGFTIDGPDSRDLDDAVWVEKIDGGFRVVVSVTAVAEEVPKGSSADERALDRVETSYGKTKNRPMLPRALAEEKASLLPGEPRRVVAVAVDMDKDLAVRRADVGLGVLRSRAKLSHADVPQILADPGHELHAQVSLCSHVAQGLVERRRAAGAFVFYDLNHGWVTTEEGHVKKLKDTRETIGYVVVQELMILANATMAELCAREEIPVPFRNHTAKAHAPERTEIMERLAAGLREPLRGLEVLQKQVNLVMNRADYGAVLKGHYGLNLAAYLHCTSPIRRYPDLLAQRQIIAHVRRRAGEAVELPHGRDEVEHLSKVVNSTIESRRAAEAEHHKRQAEEKAHGAVAGDVDLSKLGGKEFERVVKVIVRSGEYAPALTRAFLERMRDGTINVIDLYLGLLESPRTGAWRPLHEAIVTYLAENPSAGPSVASVATNLRQWDTPDFSVGSDGPDHLRTHTVVARVRVPRGSPDASDGLLESVPVTSRVLKEAKQRALVQVMATLVGVALPEEQAVPVATRPTPAPTRVPELTDNPVSALQEFAQGLGKSLPGYEYVRVAGSDHAPRFECACSYDGRTIRGTVAASKKTAKKLAAEAMIRAIRGAASS